jgi:hypothetical protein
MSSTLTIVYPTLPVERRETLIVPDGDRLESVQTLYHEQTKNIGGVCWTFQEYELALRQLESEGWSITQQSCEPIVEGYDSWNVQITGVRKLRYEAEGQFDFQVNK